MDNKKGFPWDKVSEKPTSRDPAYGCNTSEDRQHMKVLSIANIRLVTLNGMVQERVELMQD